MSLPHTPPLLYLSADDVRRSLSMADAIDAMRAAFSELSAGQVTLPGRQCMTAAGKHGDNLIMPCHCASLKIFSLKTVTVYDENPEQHGLPTIQALVVLTDDSTGMHLAVIDGGSLTAIRTGAASGLATDVLARPDAASAAVFGAGVQARTQLEAVSCVRPIREARVYDVHPAAADEFAAEMTEYLGLPVRRVDSSAEALADIDIVCTATPSSKPVFDDQELPPGAHVNAVGVYHPDMAEIPAATVCRARVVVDHRESALEEAGDLILPINQGLVREPDVTTELGAILLGNSAGRTDASEVTLFKSVGVAIQDLYAGARALDHARELELGTRLS